MASFTERQRPTGRLEVWWTAFLLAGLLLASVWDGDGDPDNIPQAIVMLTPRSARTPEEQTTGDEDGDSSDRPASPRPRPRHHRFSLRELFCRHVAVPSRGPPEGGRDGRS